MADAEVVAPPRRRPSADFMTERQREFLEWILAFLAREGRTPKHREMGAGLGGLSPNGVTANLTALARKGWVVMAGGQAGNLQVTAKALALLPIAGASGGLVRLRPLLGELTPAAARELAAAIVAAANEAEARALAER